MVNRFVFSMETACFFGGSAIDFLNAVYMNLEGIVPRPTADKRLKNEAMKAGRIETSIELATPGFGAVQCSQL
jgi:hypothetical protein